MSDPSASDQTDSLVTLESLPAGSLSMSQLDTLSEADVIEIAAPLVIDTTTSRVTHFYLVYEDTHHFLGLNPTNDQWDQILAVVDTEDTLVLESAVTVHEDESGEVKIGFDPDKNPELEEIVEFVWEYVEYTYPETDALYNVMDEALGELLADDE